MDTTQYLDVFIDESTEHLDILYNQLLLLEKNPQEKSVIEEIFRAAHTMKGMSATMGFDDLASLTHNLENVLDDIRNDKITVHTHIIDVLFAAVDHLNSMVEDLANGGDGKRDIQQILVQLEEITSGSLSPSTSTIESQADPVADASDLSLDEFELAILDESEEQGYTNYEISVTIREDCLLKSVRVYMVFEALEKFGEVIKSDPPVNDLEEEKFDQSFVVLLVSKHEAKEISDQIKNISEIEDVTVKEFSLANYRTKQQIELDNEQSNQDTNNQVQTKSAPAPRKMIRVNIDRLDALMNLFEELIIDRGKLEKIASEFNHDELKETVEHMQRISTDMQNVILNMRMVPISQVFNRFPSMIRQIARDLNKNIQLEIIGAETELDRTVIDEIGDPLVHLLRNAADHGIEMPEERKKKGKAEVGTIKLQAYHSGNFIFIEIEDDGAGINKEAVINKAIRNDIITADEAETLSEQQIYDLLMHSGFSTTDKVSDLSGRGVGLDVVKNTIETLGGSITIESEPGVGSKFSIQLPLTLSIISVLLVQLQKEIYAIPLSSIIETLKIPKSDIIEMHNNKVLDYRGKVVPLVFLDKVFSVPDHDEERDQVSVVIVQRGNQIAGLVVDSFIGQQEIVIKSLGNYLRDIPAISGATILGDGKVALIIDANALIHS